MKKTFLLAAFAFATLGASAQDHQKREERLKMTTEQRAEMRTQRMAKELNLTPEQTARVREANLKYQATELVARRQQQMQQNREDFAKLQSQRMEAIQQILTQQQLEQWRQNEKGRMDREAVHKQVRMRMGADKGNQPQPVYRRDVMDKPVK